MGLCSKIFGSNPDEAGDAPDGDAPADGAGQERAAGRQTGPPRENALASPSPAQVAMGGTRVVNDQRATGAPARVDSPATQRGGVEAQRGGRSTARPALSPKVEARVHSQPTNSSP